MINYSDWQEIFSVEWPGLWARLGEATQTRERHFGRRVSFCVILNAKSGACSEDCSFCSQSGRVKGDAPRYPLLARENLVAAAKAAAAAGASRFSIVTSGWGMVNPREQEAIIEAVAAIRRAAPIRVCASLGIVGREFLRDLKAAGLYRYHHNLESAASHFPRICSTHTYGERVATIEAAKAAGLSVCVGGILGLGESVAQRWELAQALEDLAVDAIPLNFLHPLPGTALADRPRLSPLTALQAVAAFRLAFPDRSLIICGGRQVTLGSLSPLVFAAGADSLMTGDYLTTRGRLPEEDRQVLADLGLELAGNKELGGRERAEALTPDPKKAVMELPILPEIRGVLVTGTDTDVGKTVIAAGLTAALRRHQVKAVYFKPIQSGCPEDGGRLLPTDAAFARELAGLNEPLELLTPITLRLPLAPGVAAAREGRPVDLGRIAAAIRELAGRYDFLVVEGAGGLYVPLMATNFLVLDLGRWLKLPLLVVARAGLGTINHTALTVAAARQHGLEVAGIILNRYPESPSLAEQTNPAVIEALTASPILARVPEVGNLKLAAEREALLAALAEVCGKLALAVG